MKTLVVTNFYPPFERGGGQDVAVLTVEGLRSLKHDVVVLTATPWQGRHSFWPQRAVEQGVVVYRWYPLNFYALVHAAQKPYILRLLWTWLDLVNPFAWLAVRAVLKKEKPDFIISHNCKGMGMLLPRLCAQKAPYVHVLHDVQLVEPSGLLYPETVDQQTVRLANRIYARLTRWLFSTVPVVVAPSRFLLDFYQSRGFFTAAKTAVIMNPVIPPSTDRRPHDVTNIAFIGQLEPHKGVALLLEAWAQTDRMNKKLLLIGDGSLRKVVLDAATKDLSIEVLPRMVRHGQEAIWPIIDLVVVPSLCLENSPSIITEALARGIPVVASRVGGIPELAALSSRVALVEPGNAAALATALGSSPLTRQPYPLPDAQAYAQHLLGLHPFDH